MREKRTHSLPEESTLSNGIRLITDAIPSAESVAVSVWVDVGSRYESANESGIAHFLEHMAFKGTKRRSAKQIAEEFDNIGGYLNAFTSREHTVYLTKTLYEDAHHSFDLIGDLIQNSTFSPEEIEKERDVVLQEIAMTNDTPDDIVFDYHQEIAFKNQSLGRSILGTSELVAQFDKSHLTSFIDKHYSADRIVISVAGNISHQKAKELAEEHFASIKPHSKKHTDNATYHGGRFLESRDLEQVHIVLGRKGASYHDPSIYATQILASILGGGMSSRLFQEIREERGLVYGVSAYTNGYNDTGLFCIYGSTTPDKSIEFLEVTCNELEKATRNIKQEELDRARTQARASLRMGREDTSFRSEIMGRRICRFGKYVTSEDILKKLDKITIDDIQQSMKHILSAPEYSIAAVGPIEEIEKKYGI